MKTFEVIEVTIGDEVIESIRMTDENGATWGVPIDPGNADYQAYLASLEETI